MSSTVHLESITVDLGGFRILSEVSLSASPGEVIGVVGANGSGKTTLVRVIATLVEPRSGSGSVLGARLGSRGVSEVRDRIGMISHGPSVIPELTLAENLEHIVRLRGASPEKVDGALRAVGLEGAADRRASDSSFGMQRRTEVARLLITHPELLLLDEAHSGLDVDATDLIDTLMQRTVSRGGAVVLVSHDTLHMEKANRILRIDKGIVETET